MGEIRRDSVVAESDGHAQEYPMSSHHSPLRTETSMTYLRFEPRPIAWQANALTSMLIRVNAKLVVASM